MKDLHRALLRVGFAAGPELGLVLAGGYALAAHQIVDRPSRDIDFATATALPLPAGSRTPRGGIPPRRPHRRHRRGDAPNGSSAGVQRFLEL